MNIVIQPYEIVQGDHGAQLNFVVVDGNGDIVDLTGASLSLAAQDANDPTQTNLTLSGSVQVDVATSGTCHYTTAVGDFPNPGTFNAQLTIASGGNSITAPNITIIVLPSLPALNN